MQGYIYLIGGGEIANGETKVIDDDIKEKAGKNSSLVFFGSAAGDSAGYIDTIQSVFGDRFNVIAATEEKGREFAINAINSASVIYLGGGTTELLLNLFERWKLVDLLRQALERGAHIAGMSAGAQALSAWYIHKDNDSMELRRGWDLVSICTLVHAQQDSITRAKVLWENNSNARDNDFIAISERAAWRMNTVGGQKVGVGEIWQEITTEVNVHRKC